MNYTVLSVTACTGLFVGMAGTALLVHRFAHERTLRTEDSDAAGVVTGSVFALLGLLIAFSFAGAFSRFDTRRQLVVQEANAIGTAFLRLDLVADAAREPLKEKFRQYLVSRAALYDLLVDPPAARAELANSVRIQDEIWKGVLDATKGPEGPEARLLLLPALNEMIDLTTSHAVAVQTHPPLLVFAMLFLVSLASAALLGHAAGAVPRLNRVYVMSFAALTSFMIYVILDVEYPRYGLVRLDSVHQILVQLGSVLK